MNFKDLYNKVFSKATITVPNKVNFKNNIFEQQQYRYIQDITNYKTALQAAESIYSPNRNLLYNLYNNITLDTHLASLTESRKIKSLSHPFKIIRNGVDDEEATKLFNSKWFQNFLEFSWESVMYGFSLIQIDSITDGKPVVELVPRQHVKPLQNLIVQNPGDTQGYDYTTAPFNEWFIPVGKVKDLGLLAKVAPLVLLKTNTISNWAQHNELFGSPLRVGRTNLADEDRAKSMYAALRDMASAAFAVLDKDDDVELVASVKSEGKVYENFLRWCDEQISKTLLGGTMNSDNGSSRSQSEVHERLADEYSEFDLKNLTYVVNDKLIPLLINLGLDLTNCTFEFYEIEDRDELFTMTSELLKLGVYDIDDKWIETKFGVPVTKREIQQPPTLTPDTTGNFQKPV